MEGPRRLTSCDLTTLLLDASCSFTVLTSKLLNSVSLCVNDQLLWLRSASLSSKKLSPQTGSELRAFTAEEVLLFTSEAAALGTDSLSEIGVMFGVLGKILLPADIFTHVSELPLPRSKSFFIAFL